MEIIAGVRKSILYTVNEIPLDPRWSRKYIQRFLSLCATGQSLGWTEERSVQVAEALVIKQRCGGIYWPPESMLVKDIQTLESFISRE